MVIKKFLKTLLILEFILYQCQPIAYPQEVQSDSAQQDSVTVDAGGPSAEAAAQPGETQGAGQRVSASEGDQELAEAVVMPMQEPGCVTLNFKDADIRAVLTYLSDVGGVDIIPSPDVTGTITIKLTNKPWQTALDILVRNYGFAYEREGNVIRVVTVDSLKMEELQTEVVELNYANCGEVIDSIKDMLTERGKITSDARTNKIIITDVPANIYKIKQVLKKLDQKTPQIMIEAKIIETELNKDEKMGIDWNLVAGLSGSRRPTTLPFNAFEPDWGLQSKVIPQFFPVGTTGTSSTTVGSGGATTTVTPGDFPTGDTVAADAATRAFPFVDIDAFTYGTLDFTGFSMVLQYLKARSNTEIISNPRITTLNNKEAKIFVGSVYYYISQMKEDDSTDKTTYEYTEKEIGIRLMVTPNVNDAGEIVIKLKPEIKAVIGYQQLTKEFQLPIFSTREAETQVMIKDGDTVFIGGLIKDEVKKFDKKFPILGDLFGDVPYAGNLVKYKSETKSKTELIFFMTVHIVKDGKELFRMPHTAEGVPESPADNVFVQMGRNIVNDAPPSLDGKSVDMNASKTSPVFDFRKKAK